MLPHATSRREISQVYQRSSQSTAISYVLLCDLAKPPHGADKSYFSVQELSWEVLLFVFYVTMEINLGQFRSRESAYIQKRPSRWANAIYP